MRGAVGAGALGEGAELGGGVPWVPAGDEQVSAPTNASERTVLFMGVQPDSEARRSRIYDGTGRTRAGLAPRDAQPAALSGRPGALYLSGGGRCVCGRCLFEAACSGVRP